MPLPAVSAPDPALLARWDSLAAQTRAHDHAYYVLDRPAISDRDYDALFRELQDPEEAHVELRRAASRRTPSARRRSMVDTRRIADAWIASLPAAGDETPRAVKPVAALESGPYLVKPAGLRSCG